MTVRTIAHAAVGEDKAVAKVGIAGAVADGSPLEEAGHSADDQAVLDRTTVMEDMALAREEPPIEGDQVGYQP
jgi:hypothetical protein